MTDITFDDVKVGDRFRLLYPLECGDGIEFPESAEFQVTEVSKHPDGADVWHSIRLPFEEKDSHWMALPVPVPPHQPDYLHYLNVRIQTLNCIAIGNSGHTLRQDCGIIKVLLKGVSDGETKTKNIQTRV